MRLSKYAILRNLNVSRGTRGGFNRLQPTASGGSATAPPEPNIEVVELSPRDIADLSRDPKVVAAAPSMPIKLIAPVKVPADTQPLQIENTTWGVLAVGANRSQFNGAGIKVGIIDTGIDKNHAAFAGMTLTEKDYTGSGNGDADGHGTHCAGTIFGRAVRNTRIGVAPGVTEAFIARVFGANGNGVGTAGLANAINDAARAGCQVISMSLGFDFPGYAAALMEQYGDTYPKPYLAALALNDYRQNIRLFDELGEFIASLGALNGNEILLVAAAGNESERQLTQNSYELPVAPPSAANGFISVGALGRVQNQRLNVAAFSNTGCHVSAPGVGVLSAKANTPDQLVEFSGTSMATPHVAGVAALWLQQIAGLPQPNFGNGFNSTVPRARQRVEGAATHATLTTGFDPHDVGAGLVQAP